MSWTTYEDPSLYASTGSYSYDDIFDWANSIGYWLSNDAFNFNSGKNSAAANYRKKKIQDKLGDALGTENTDWQWYYDSSDGNWKIQYYEEDPSQQEIYQQYLEQQQAKAEQEQKEKDEASAKQYLASYNERANDALTQSKAAQDDLERDLGEYNTELGKQYSLADSTKQTSDANARWSSDNDYFQNLSNLQSTMRNLNQARGGSYGSINSSMAALGNQQHEATNASLANALQSQLQANQDTNDASKNSADASYNEHLRDIMTSQGKINQEYDAAMSELRSGLESELSGISTKDVRDQYFDSNGNFINQPSWTGNTASNQSDLYDASKWSENLRSYQSPTKINNLINSDTINRVNKNRSSGQFRTSLTDAWTQS